MNVGISLFGVITCLVGCGFFACYAYKMEVIITDKITGKTRKDMSNQYIYGFFTFVTGFLGIALLLDALKLV